MLGRMNTHRDSDERQLSALCRRWFNARMKLQTEMPSRVPPNMQSVTTFRPVTVSRSHEDAEQRVRCMDDFMPRKRDRF